MGVCFSELNACLAGVEKPERREIQKKKCETRA